jgi:hypothetical protein
LTGSRAGDETSNRLEKLAPLIAVKYLACSRAITAIAMPFGLRHCQQDGRGLSAQLMVNSAASCRLIGQYTSLLAPLPQAGMAARLQGP